MNNFRKKLKNLLLIISTSMLSLLFIMNSNYVNNLKNQMKLKKEENKLFDKKLSSRLLEQKYHKNTYSTYTDTICEKGSDQLRDYYLYGNVENILEINDLVTNPTKGKDKENLKTLINVIYYSIFNKNKVEEEEENILENESIKDDYKTYFKHKSIVFIIIVISSSISWIIFIIFYCCNCCCCCCCKKQGCKFPLSFLNLILYILLISISIYGLIKTNTIITGISDTKCSILKFFDQALEGETKQALPKWIGFYEIINILNDIKEEIKELRKRTLNDFYNKIDNIKYKNIIFKNRMEESGEAFYTPSDRRKYSNLYSSDEYYIKSRGISGRYVLDLIKIFGRKVNNDDEEKYEPKNSILDNWHNEYKSLSKNTDIYLQEIINDLITISDHRNIDLVENIENIIDNMNTLKDFFDDINENIEDILINKSDIIDKHGKKTLNIFFLLLLSVNFLLIVCIFLLCCCSGSYNDTCCTRCFFKCLIHVLWNINCILMIISFILGFIFILFGVIGNDIVSVISFIISEEGEDNIIYDKLGEAKDYLNICINGNGRIMDLLNINQNQNNSLYNLIKNQENINQIIKEFQNRKKYSTYTYYINQLKARLNLSVIPILIKDNYEIELPIYEVYYQSQADKYLKFDVELELMNDLIKNKEKGSKRNEQWKINSFSPNECTTGNDPIFSWSEFNPLKCRPFDRDWIQSTSFIDIKTEAKIVSDTLSFLDNANKQREREDDSEPQSFISILNDLKNSYSDYLDNYIMVLDAFNNTLNKITEKLRKDNDSEIFSFMNGKIIGLNLKVMRKNIKNKLGKDSKQFGTLLIILGFTLALSISFTILFIVIININLKNNNYDIHNYYHDTPMSIFRYQQSSSSRDNQTMTSNDFSTHNSNYYVKEAYKFLIYGCNIDPSLLDKRGNC